MIELESHNFATPNKLICIIKKKKTDIVCLLYCIICNPAQMDQTQV